MEEQQVMNEQNNVNNTPTNTGKATASLVCGILSVTICCGSLVLGIVAIVLSTMYVNETGDVNNSSAKAGKIMGIISIAISVVAFIIYMILIAIGAANGAFN